MIQSPKIGDIVLYYQGDYEAPEGYKKGATGPGTNGTRFHPAIITRVWTDDCVNLLVFLDAVSVVVRTNMVRLPDEVFAEGLDCTNSGWRWREDV